MAQQTSWTCDACDYSVTGYTKKDLDGDDWRFHTVKGARVFLMCPECREHFEPIWDARKAKAGAAT